MEDGKFTKVLLLKLKAIINLYSGKNEELARSVRKMFYQIMIEYLDSPSFRRKGEMI